MYDAVDEPRRGAEDLAGREAATSGASWPWNNSACISQKRPCMPAASAAVDALGTGVTAGTRGRSAFGLIVMLVVLGFAALQS
jgi:hypothetical protein